STESFYQAPYHRLNRHRSHTPARNTTSSSLYVGMAAIRLPKHPVHLNPVAPTNQLSFQQNFAVSDEVQFEFAQTYSDRFPHPLHPPQLSHHPHTITAAELNLGPAYLPYQLFPSTSAFSE